MSEAPETTALTTGDERGVRLSGPRLPYHPALEERYGIDRGTWKVLCEAFYPMAEGPESIIMAVSYCKARNLDIMKKPVHIVPVYDKKRGKMVDTVWPAIAESRITAMRTQHYAGKDETVFGPEVTEQLGGVEVTYPQWASVTVYRFVQGVRCAFTGERVRWKEYYAKAKRDTAAPNDMWRVKAYSQLSKCAEASALRCAFPEEDSGPTAEEMDGQEVASTLAPEPLSGSGVMSRLPGAQDAAGMDRGHVERETAALPAPDAKPSAARRARRKPAETEATEPPQAAEEAPEPVNEQSGAVIMAEAEELDPQKAVNERLSADLETMDNAGRLHVEVITEGYPAQNEVYMLNGDEWTFNDARGEDRRDTYKNGEPFSDAGRAKGYLIYEDHPRQTQAPAAEEAQAEDVDEAETLPPELATLIEATEQVESWQAMKDAMAEFQKTALWPTLSAEQQNHIRASAWETLEDRAVDWLPDRTKDISAFRLWIEAQDDMAVISEGLATLQADPEFQGRSEGLRGQIASAAMARLNALSGA